MGESQGERELQEGHALTAVTKGKNVQRVEGIVAAGIQTVKGVGHPRKAAPFDLETKELWLVFRRYGGETGRNAWTSSQR